MGFRAVTDLSDYSVAELAELTEKASALLRQKLTGDASDSGAASVASFSVVEPEASADAPSSRAESSGQTVGPPPGLRSPFECPYHCKHCYEQCCRRPESHKNHACLAHRHMR